jgi:hypothetical protein
MSRLTLSRGEGAALQEVEWTKEFEEQFRCQRSVVARHAGIVVLQAPHSSEAYEQEDPSLFAMARRHQNVAARVWELDEGEQRVLLYTLSNSAVVLEQRCFAKQLKWTCGGWGDAALRTFALRGGLPPEVAESGCRGAWSPRIHQTLSRQVRSEIRIAWMSWYRILGRDVLKHVMFPFIAFRRGPLVRLFVSKELMTAVDGTVIWKEIAVLNARLPA